MHHILFRHTLIVGALIIVLAACDSQPGPIGEAQPSQVPVATASVVTAPSSTSPAATVVVSTPSPAPVDAPRALFLDPDGKLQAATTTNRDITLVASLPAGNSTVVLSPNGNTLAFIEDGQLKVQSLGANPATRVVTPTGDLETVAFAPDGHSLLYAVDTSDDPANQPHPQLYLSQLDGQPSRVLGDGFAPVWSPGGDRFAFIGPPFAGSPAFGGGPGGRLMIAASDSSNPRAVGPPEEVHPGWQPLLWSADDTRLAAGSALIDATSGNVIAQGKSDGVYIAGIEALAPDGHAFAYWRNLRSGDPASEAGITAHSEIVLVSDDGQAHTVARTQPKSCPCLAVAEQIRPLWTVDGDRLIVADSQLGVRLFANTGLPMGRLRLPKGAVVNNDYAPSLSEDGQRLLLTLIVDGHNDVWLLDTYNGMLRHLGAGIGLGWRH